MTASPGKNRSCEPPVRRHALEPKLSNVNIQLPVLHQRSNYLTEQSLINEASKSSFESVGIQNHQLPLASRRGPLQSQMAPTSL
jgi:hypothetical protein